MRRWLLDHRLAPEDTRYIAHCVGQTQGEFAHLAGDWWQLKDRTAPSDL